MTAGGSVAGAVTPSAIAAFAPRIRARKVAIARAERDRPVKGPGAKMKCLTSWSFLFIADPRYFGLFTFAPWAGPPARGAQRPRQIPPAYDRYSRARCGPASGCGSLDRKSV